MIREFLLPLIFLVSAVMITILLQHWKLSESRRFILILFIINLLAVGAFLAWRTQERLFGVLVPAAESPFQPKQWDFSRENPPDSSFKVLLGDSLFVTTDPSHTVLKLAGKDIDVTGVFCTR